MTEEFNLNLLINGNQERRLSMEHVETTTLADAQETIISEAEEMTNVAEVHVIDNVSVHQYIINHVTKLSNVNLIDITQFATLELNRFLLFISNEESNASLMIVEQLGNMWIDNNIVPDSIRVESSGIIIDSPTITFYVGKTNIISATKHNGIVNGMNQMSKAKTPNKVKSITLTIENVANPDVDTIKLFARNISPRLYKLVQNETDRSEIKNKVMAFMHNIKDVNHLIKLNKELLIPCQL